MDYFDAQRIMEMYGVLPNATHVTSPFIRFPPGLSFTSTGLIKPNHLHEKLINDTSSINAKLNDFQQMYKRFSAGLIGANASLIPPGHPLFTRLNSSSLLQTENEKLRKENLELKQQLEKSSNNQNKKI
ncbi:MAG: hypothetical protein ACT4OW_01080 [Nitrososphaerota archaeon]